MSTFWIDAAIVLYVILVLVALLGYTPSSPEYGQLSQRGNIIGGVLMLDVIIIVFLMVVKPTRLNPVPTLGHCSWSKLRKVCVRPMVETVQVWRGSHREPENLFGPLPGLRDGDVVAYEFELPRRFEPWPGRTRLERTFVLLDVGVSFANPCWQRATKPDGSLVEGDPAGKDSWYVDLVSVEVVNSNRYTFRDLYVDVIVPTDGRHYRMLDLNEYADAMIDGKLSLSQSADGLRRWQHFLDRYLHGGRWPRAEWADFPPALIRGLSDLPTPFAPPIQWNG